MSANRLMGFLITYIASSWQVVLAISQGNFREYHYVLIFPAVFYAYFYLAEIHYLNIHSASPAFCLTNHRCWELYHQQCPNACISINFLIYLFWVTVMPVNSIISFLPLNFLQHWLIFLAVHMGHTSSCRQVLDWWSALSHHWQDSYNLFVLLFWRKSLVTSTDFACSNICLFCQYSVSSLKIWWSIRVISLVS